MSAVHWVPNSLAQKSCQARVYLPFSRPQGDFSASSCCAGVHRGNTWIFTKADRLSASPCPVAKVGLTKRAETQTTGNWLNWNKKTFGLKYRKEVLYCFVVKLVSYLEFRSNLLISQVVSEIWPIPAKGWAEILWIETFQTHVGQGHWITQVWN